MYKIDRMGGGGAVPKLLSITSDPAVWYLKMHMIDVIEYLLDIDLIFIRYSAMLKYHKN